MTDQSAPDEPGDPAGGSGPDYDLDDVIVLESPEQFRAIGDPLRFELLGLLSERAATTSQLATALGRPKGTVGHHLNVLAEAGLVRVVRTRQVRALTEKYYGRVARRSVVGDEHAHNVAEMVLRQALSEVGGSSPDPAVTSVGLSHLRLDAAQAEAYGQRLSALHDEFMAESPAPGAPVFGLVTGLYPTTWRALDEEHP